MMGLGSGEALKAASWRPGRDSGIQVGHLSVSAAKHTLRALQCWSTDCVCVQADMQDDGLELGPNMSLLCSNISFYLKTKLFCQETLVLPL